MKLTKRQSEIWELYQELGVKAEVAKRLGVSRSTVRNAVKVVEKKLQLTPTDYQPTKTTRHVVYDAEGNPTLKEEWVRSAPKAYDILEHLKTHTPINKFNPKPPKDLDEDLMVEWCLADLHHGMRAAKEETGQDHNLELSKQLVVKAAEDIFNRAPDVGLTRIVSIGDFIHSDLFSNKTEKSGHSLWTADTYVNIARCGIEAIETAVEICLLKSREVELEFLPGNHCQQSSTWLQLLMEQRYRNNKRVKVSTSQTTARFAKWGVNFMGYHHGHSTNSTRLAMEVLTKAAQEGGFKFFYARTGHLHNGNRMLMTTEDSNGVIIERIPTMAPKDKFSADGCYNSMRGTVANVFHKTKGQRCRIDILPEILV